MVHEAATGEGLIGVFTVFGNAIVNSTKSLQLSRFGIPKKVKKASLAAARVVAGATTETWVGMGGSSGPCSLELVNKRVTRSAYRHP